MGLQAVSGRRAGSHDLRAGAGLERGTSLGLLCIPVEPGRGFVLHTADYSEEATLPVADDIAITATLDIMRAIGRGEGPRHSLFALGYAGWAPGQLDAEIHANGWLCAPADEGLLFDARLDDKWERAIGKIGVRVDRLSGEAGHA